MRAGETTVTRMSSPGVASGAEDVRRDDIRCSARDRIGQGIRPCVLAADTTPTVKRVRYVASDDGGSDIAFLCSREQSISSSKRIERVGNWPLIYNDGVK